MNKCELCKKEFKLKHHLIQHLKRKIPCNNIIQCDRCLVIFKTKQKLTNHQNRKTPCEKVDLEQEVKDLKAENEKLKLEKENRILNQTIINTQNTTVNKLKREIDNLKEINKLLISHLDLNINTGFIYILTNLCYEIQDIYKVGKTINLNNRLSNYNTPKVEKDKYQYVYSIKSNNIDDLEKYIHNHPKLKEFKTNNELYKIKFNDLKNIIIEIKNEFENL